MLWCAGWTYIVTTNWRLNGTFCRYWNQRNNIGIFNEARIFRCRAIWPKYMLILKFILISMLCNQWTVTITNVLCKSNKESLATWYFQFTVVWVENVKPSTQDWVLLVKKLDIYRSVMMHWIRSKLCYTFF